MLRGKKKSVVDADSATSQTTVGDPPPPKPAKRPSMFASLFSKSVADPDPSNRLSAPLKLETLKEHKSESPKSQPARSPSLRRTEQSSSSPNLKKDDPFEVGFPSPVVTGIKEVIRRGSKVAARKVGLEDGVVGPLTGLKDGAAWPTLGPKNARPLYVLSARLPALTATEIEAFSTASIAPRSTNVAAADNAARLRGESDPCPMFGSTMMDFGFEEEMETQEVDEDDVILLTKKMSFQKQRTPSFNSNDRVWENRRSLQLSINHKGLGGPSDTVHVSAATLDRLVEYVVTSAEFMEASQVSGFLLTYHSYVDSQGLLTALAARYDVATLAKDQVARIRTLYVMQRWIEEHWYDFESDEMLLFGIVRFSQTRKAQFEKGSPTHDPCLALLIKLGTVEELAKSKRERKNKRGSVATVGSDEDDDKDEAFVVDPLSPDAKERAFSESAPRLLKHHSKLMIKLEKAPASDVPKDFSQYWIAKLDGKPAHLILASSHVTKLEAARQITLLEHEMYRKIAPTELIAQATKQLIKPPENVQAMISHFNYMTKFVALTICSVTDFNSRVHLFRKWVKIGRECLRLNNYNAVFEIMAGLHSVGVYRLQKTRNAQNQKTKILLEQLEEVTSRKNNYAIYRALLAQNSVPIQPSVPFIGATLTDLSFLDSGNANVVENEAGDALINFTKHRRVAQVIALVKKFQDYGYHLDVVPELIAFFVKNVNASFTDKDLYAMSLMCEPAAATNTNFFDQSPSSPPPAAEDFPGTNRSSLGTDVDRTHNHRREESKSGFLWGKRG